MDRILRKEFLKLARELGRERFVVRYDERRLLRARHNVCHGKSFAATSHAKQSLIMVFFFNTRRQLVNSAGLVSCRLEWRRQFKFHYSLQITD